MKASTLKYIADKLNVSVSTVSRAVNQKEYVKEETRARVLEALEEYNYVPNDIARSLKMQASKTIGVILPDICEIFFGMIIKGIDQVVSEAGYTIIVADSNENKDNEEKYLEMLYQKRIDALVLATVDLKGKKVRQFISNSIPVVFIDNIPKLDNIDSVTINNDRASEIAVDFLVHNGHRKIATIIGSIEETTGYDRLEGYEAALGKHSILRDKNLIQYGNYKEDEGYRCMNHLLENREKHPFTAVYVTSEMMTFGAIKAIHQWGLKIPEDISLIGFDIHDKAGLVSPSIATIRQPENLLGIRTGELLLKRLHDKESVPDGAEMSVENVLLEPYLIEGESVKKL